MRHETLSSSDVVSSGSVTVSPPDSAPVPTSGSNSKSSEETCADDASVPERRTLKTSRRSCARFVSSSAAMERATSRASTATHPSANALVDVRAAPSSDVHGSVPGHPAGSSSESTTRIDW